MSTFQWIFIIAILVILPIIVFLIITFTGFLDGPSGNINGDPVLDLSLRFNPSGWSRTEAIDGPDGLCNIFKTPNNSLNDLDNPLLVDQIKKFPNDCTASGGIGTDNCCQDPDTIIARKVRRTCLVPKEGQAQSAPCINQNGLEVPPGITEEFFEQCVTSRCEGVFQRIKNTTSGDCLTVLPDNINLSMQPCTVSDDDETQRFRILWRTNPNTPNITTINLESELASPNIDNFARIIHRESGKDVIPTDQEVESIIALGDTQDFIWLRGNLSDPLTDLNEIGNVCLLPGDCGPGLFCESEFSNTCQLEYIEQLAVNTNDIPFLPQGAIIPDPFLSLSTDTTIKLEPGRLDFGSLSGSLQELEYVL